MSIPLALNEKDYGGLDDRQRKLLYEPIVLEHCLSSKNYLPVYSPEDQEIWVHDEAQPDRTAFHFFVNKLAQVCDNERGGKTITALVILEGSLGPNYVLGSNGKDENESRATRSFLQSLLQLIGDNPDHLGKQALEKRVLWLTLSFNAARIEEYRLHLNTAVRECLEDFRRHGEDRDSRLLQDLEALQKDCDFAIDLSSDNTRLKTMSDCETLIKAIGQFRPNGHFGEISKRARDAEMTRSESWCELKHFLGRWLSYRQAGNAIISCAERWPDLFHNFDITILPTGTRILKPLQKSNLTASVIVENIAAQDKIDPDRMKTSVHDLQMIGLDELVRQQAASRKFQPILHAEMLLHEHLSSPKHSEPIRFWKNWEYIGSSKPVCRLCHYYFESLEDNKIQVRVSHQNLYVNWRLPRFDQDDHEAAAIMNGLLEKIAKRMRDDVRRTLRERSIKRKGRDSNTYTSTPEYLRTDASVDGMARQLSISTISEENETE